MRQLKKKSRKRRSKKINVEITAFLLVLIILTLTFFVAQRSSNLTGAAITTLPEIVEIENQSFNSSFFNQSSGQLNELVSPVQNNTSIEENIVSVTIPPSITKSVETFDQSLGIEATAQPGVSPRGLTPQVCNAQLDSVGQNTFSNACNGTYPAACGSGGDLLSCDDGITEAPNATANNWEGVQTNTSNTSITDCYAVRSVSLCYEWWRDTNAVQTCRISVDADQGTSYNDVTTVCPGTSANPGVTCSDVTSLETWTCNTFFNPGSGGGFAKAQAQAGAGAELRTLFVDALYFNVTYAALPVVDSLILNTTNITTNDTNVNLTAYASASDQDGASVKVTYNWLVNNTPLAFLNMPFEGINGTTTQNAWDYSGFGNNGSAGEGVLWNATGGYDGKGAYMFNGSTGSYIIINNVTQTGYQSICIGGCTFSAWIYITKTSLITQSREIVTRKGPTLGTSDRHFRVIVGPPAPQSSQALNFDIWQNGSSNSASCTATSSAQTILNYTWQYVTARYNLTHVAVFINGTQQAATACSFSSLSADNWMNSNEPILIGAEALSSPAGFFNGSIDEVMIFNRSLSDEQIKALYRNQTNVTTASETVLGETWKVQAYPNNGTRDGAVVVSNSVVIRDATAPTVTITTPTNGSNYSSSTTLQNFNATIRDSDSNISIVSFMFNSNTTVFNVTASNSSGNWNATVDLSTLVEGRHYVKVFANDSYNNIDNTQFINFTIDRTAPLVGALWMNVTNASNFSSSLVSILYFNATVNDTTLTTQEVRFGFYNGNATGFNITGVKNAAGVWTANVTALVLSDGVYTVILSANDTVDNRNNTIANLTFTLDRTAPLVTAFWMNASNASNFSSSLVSILYFNATVNDTTLSTQEVRFGFYNGNASGFNVTGVKNAAGVWTANVTASVLSDGVYTVLISANDTVDNRNNTVANLTFTLDRTAPLVNSLWLNYTGPAQNNNTNHSVAIIRFNATVNDTTLTTQEVRFGFYNGNASGFNITGIKDGAGVWSANVSTTSLSDAVYTVLISANDTVDNRNNTIANLTFTSDRTAPIVGAFWMNASNASNFSSSLVSILYFNATVNDTTLSTQEVRFGFYNGNATGVNITGVKNAAGVWTANVTAAAFTDGLYTAILSANDTVDNRNNTIANLTFTLDRTAPNVSTFFMNTSNATSYIVGTATVIVINATLNDSLGTVQEVVFGILNTNNNTQFNITASKQNSFWYTNLSMNTLSIGSYTIWLYGNDTLGNMNNSIANLRLRIPSADSAPPSGTALIPALNSFLAYGNATEIAVNVTDGGIISMVLANISLPNGSIETLTLSNSTSFPLKFNISYTPLINGVYNVTFIANDSLDNKNGTERTNFTAQNVAPVITFVSSLPSQSILEGTYRTINFSFTAFDGNNAGDLDNASAQVRINLSGEAERLNTSCTPLAVLDAYTINYSCSVNIWYYDGAGTWTINASVKDDINTYVENSSNFFEVLSTTAMVMNPTALTWPTLELGTTNKTANNDPFTINNTGNKDIAAGGITVTGYDLQGTSIPTDYIRAQNFSIWHVNGSSSCSGVSCLECNGTIMVNATAEPLAYANISAANNSLAYQNETSGQENLFVCLMTVPAEIIRQSYNTAGINTAPWIITVS